MPNNNDEKTRYKKGSKMKKKKSFPDMSGIDGRKKVKKIF